MTGTIWLGAHEPTVLDDERDEERAVMSLDSLESYSRLRSAKPSRAALLESVDDWAVSAEEALADIRSDAQRGLVGMKLPLAKLKSAVEQIEKRMRESEAAE